MKAFDSLFSLKFDELKASSKLRHKMLLTSITKQVERNTCHCNIDDGLGEQVTSWAMDLFDIEHNRTGAFSIILTIAALVFGLFNLLAGRSDLRDYLPVLLDFIPIKKFMSAAAGYVVSFVLFGFFLQVKDIIVPLNIFIVIVLFFMVGSMFRMVGVAVMPAKSLLKIVEERKQFKEMSSGERIRFEWKKIFPKKS